MPHALSQRASQKPSRPASKATAICSILRPAFSASSRHRYSSFSNVLSSTASFFNGWRSTPGTMPATSQLDRLISMTAISVPSGSRAVRDRLRSFNFCMGRSIGSHQRRWMQYPRRRPIVSSIMGFEDEAEQSKWRPYRQCNGRSKRTCELTSSIVPRGTSFHGLVELEIPPIVFVYLRPHATTASRVQRNSVPSTHMRCMITANRRARATIAFFIPRRLAICIAQALSQDHFFEPRPFLRTQHALSCFVEHDPHHLIS